MCCITITRGGVDERWPRSNLPEKVAVVVWDLHMTQGPGQLSHAPARGVQSVHVYTCMRGEAGPNLPCRGFARRDQVSVSERANRTTA
jgi:hypothetical protein